MAIQRMRELEQTLAALQAPAGTTVQVWQSLDEKRVSTDDIEVSTDPPTFEAEANRRDGNTDETSVGRLFGEATYPAARDSVADLDELTAFEGDPEALLNYD